ncbi:MAG: PRC-barrel domain containing protein [Candidatus Omnitrophica bacterium]|nr:PRC-barrel domain containing protein [Candidatus Omnitrophota bacterium]
MLRSIREIQGYRINASDGEIGKAADFFFEENEWSVRYLVVKTGNWLFGKEVLVSPSAFGEKAEPEKGVFPVDISREKVRESPEVDAHKPVSREEELEMMKHYSWPVYWNYEAARGTAAGMPPVMVKEIEEAIRKGEFSPRENDLRSAKEVTGYALEAEDGRIGHVTDLIVDDTSWRIRYMVVDTNDWLPGGKVLVGVDWADSIDWAESRVKVARLTREQVKACPEYDPSRPVNRDYEEKLHDHFGRPKYWE